MQKRDPYKNMQALMGGYRGTDQRKVLRLYRAISNYAQANGSQEKFRPQLLRLARNKARARQHVRFAKRIVAKNGGVK